MLENAESLMRDADAAAEQAQYEVRATTCPLHIGGLMYCLPDIEYRGPECLQQCLKFSLTL